MNLHDSPATMTSNKEADQLVTPHSTSNSLKRPHPQHSDSHQFETKRKLIHLNSENQDINTVTPPRKKQESLKVQQHLQFPKKEQIVAEEENKDPILSIPLRQKYAHLIPDYQSAQYTAEQKMLMRVQTKLDEHLLYLKTHRGRKQGDFFKSIRCHIIVELTHLKQILSLDHTLYICSREKDKDKNMDILIDLPTNSDIQTRKIEFKQKLYRFLNANGVFQHSPRNKHFRIPYFKFDFEEKIEKNNEKTIRQMKQSQEEERKEESKLTLQHMFTKEFKFKEALYQKITDKENKIKEQARLAVAVKPYDRDGVLKVLDQVHLAYSAKRICNMFRATLIDIITKKIPLQDHLISEVLELICEKAPCYLKKVSHSKGPILQIDKGSYNEARSCLKQISL